MVTAFLITHSILFRMVCCPSYQMLNVLQVNAPVVYSVQTGLHAFIVITLGVYAQICFDALPHLMHGQAACQSINYAALPCVGCFINAPCCDIDLCDAASFWLCAGARTELQFRTFAALSRSAFSFGGHCKHIPEDVHPITEASIRIWRVLTPVHTQHSSECTPHTPKNV